MKEELFWRFLWKIFRWITRHVFRRGGDGNPWESYEDDIITKYKDVGSEELSELLNRSVRAIQQRRYYINKKKRKSSGLK